MAVLWKIQSGHDFVHRQMDGLTDDVKPVHPHYVIFKCILVVGIYNFTLRTKPLPQPKLIKSHNPSILTSLFLRTSSADAAGPKPVSDRPRMVCDKLRRHCEYVAMASALRCWTFGCSPYVNILCRGTTCKQDDINKYIEWLRKLFRKFQTHSPFKS